jgi:hypothetical protein
LGTTTTQRRLYSSQKFSSWLCVWGSLLLSEYRSVLFNSDFKRPLTDTGLVVTTDYRYDDGKKKLSGEVTSWHHWVADDSRIPKMLLILRKNHLFICKRNEGSLTGLSIANPNLIL